MLVVLILVAVVLGPVWGRRLAGSKAYVATTAGWLAAMAVVVVSGTVEDLDPGFWIFNTFLLVVGLGLTRLGARRSIRHGVRTP